MRKLTFWIWMVGWLLVSTGARAALLEWQLRGVSFDDGGTASGHFTLDTMLNAVIDFDITTTVGAQINSQFRYTLEQRAHYLPSE